MILVHDLRFGHLRDILMRDSEFCFVTPHTWLFLILSRSYIQDLNIQFQISFGLKDKDVQLKIDFTPNARACVSLPVEVYRWWSCLLISQSILLPLERVSLQVDVYRYRSNVFSHQSYVSLYRWKCLLICQMCLFTCRISLCTGRTAEREPETEFDSV